MKKTTTKKSNTPLNFLPVNGPLTGRTIRVTKAGAFGDGIAVGECGSIGELSLRAGQKPTPETPYLLYFDTKGTMKDVVRTEAEIRAGASILKTAEPPDPPTPAPAATKPTPAAAAKPPAAPPADKPAKPANRRITPGAEVKEWRMVRSLRASQPGYFLQGGHFQKTSRGNSFIVGEEIHFTELKKANDALAAKMPKKAQSLTPPAPAPAPAPMPTKKGPVKVPPTTAARSSAPAAR